MLKLEVKNKEGSSDLCFFQFKRLIGPDTE